MLIVENSDGKRSKLIFSLQHDLLHQTSLHDCNVDMLNLCILTSLPFVLVTNKFGKVLKIV